MGLARRKGKRLVWVGDFPGPWSSLVSAWGELLPREDFQCYSSSLQLFSTVGWGHDMAFPDDVL